ncbi:hypothetical protein B9G69_012700 [Bdellovibrio sp. SKB1291214]|uniref:hypothetical protein n=1 Tax=Bdellovibrio sp. SKB1291214 TaxID=1732569 RepID=UPI000B515C09|nr:hypothetical protein [Bdellovibrio sp. SKB1291214]UYL07906.1 hypothetical protein B9G69_012700 [Bdellovibrio sp. SKB1291214]
MQKYLFTIVLIISCFASAGLNEKAVSCVKVTGDTALVVTVANNENLIAVVSAVANKQERIILNRDVVHNYKYNFSSYESADHEFYLLISRMDGKGQMLLNDGSNILSADDLNCQELQ